MSLFLACENKCIQHKVDSRTLSQQTRDNWKFADIQPPTSIDEIAPVATVVLERIKRRCGTLLFSFLFLFNPSFFFPPPSLTMSGLNEKNFRRKCLEHSRSICRISEHFWGISTNIPANFREISGQLSETSRTFLRHFRDDSGTLPGHLQECSWNFSGSFREMFMTFVISSWIFSRKQSRQTKYRTKSKQKTI